jgi:hypothetical protein
LQKNGFFKLGPFNGFLKNLVKCGTPPPPPSQQGFILAVLPNRIEKRTFHVLFIQQMCHIMTLFHECSMIKDESN